MRAHETTQEAGSRGGRAPTMMRAHVVNSHRTQKKRPVMEVGVPGASLHASLRDLADPQVAIVSTEVQKGHTAWLGSHKWLVLFRDSNPGPSDSPTYALSTVLF